MAQEAKADVTVICGATTSTEGKDRALDEAMGPVRHDDPWYDYHMFYLEEHSKGAFIFTKNHPKMPGMSLKTPCRFHVGPCIEIHDRL